MLQVRHDLEWAPWGLLNSRGEAPNSFTVITLLVCTFAFIHLTMPLLCSSYPSPAPPLQTSRCHPDCSWVACKIVHDLMHACLTPWPSNFQSSACAGSPSNSPPSLHRTCSLGLRLWAGLTLTAWLSPFHLSGLRWPIICLGKSERFLGSRARLNYFYDSASYI